MSATLGVPNEETKKLSWINFYNEAEQVIHLLEKDEEVYPRAVCDTEDQSYLSKSLNSFGSFYLF